jgi:hypothetical protein
VRPNRLFKALARALDFDERATESLLAALLANVDATPQTLTRSHLRAMHADLLELIVLVFPAQGRQAVESRLRELATEP